MKRAEAHTPEEQIRLANETKHLSGEKAARKLGISVSTLYRWRGLAQRAAVDVPVARKVNTRAVDVAVEQTLTGIPTVETALGILHRAIERKVRAELLSRLSPDTTPPVVESDEE